MTSRAAVHAASISYARLNAAHSQLLTHAPRLENLARLMATLQGCASAGSSDAQQEKEGDVSQLEQMGNRCCQDIDQSIHSRGCCLPSAPESLSASACEIRPPRLVTG